MEVYKDRKRTKCEKYLSFLNEFVAKIELDVRIKKERKKQESEEVGKQASEEASRGAS